MLLCIILIFALALLGCNEESKNGNSSIERFIEQLKAKSYKFEVKDVDKDFLAGNRKRIIFDNEAIDVYFYNITLK